MSTAIIVFVVAAFATFFNNALHWYTQVTTYPLLSWVGQAEFVSFHKEYERRLPFSIYVPYTLLMFSTLLLIFLRPVEIELGWVFVLLVLNASIMIVSLVFAVPIHTRLDRQGYSDKAGIRELIRYNRVRLIISSTSSIVMLYLMVGLLMS
ncbi:hypothetical protein [Pseudanabaena sp. FACHB-2040]|uniref:hypothetical protein n=1 Tax=Pseudanabaena sp. FACHB-2040 TaxID=2692859 RepID=UPI001687169B|nr:hypothetical protein [Pseudanabaena sp. FACHB-2040]MBD2258356.1 hypothetical protein [Pseudanabaena sp. FACHB-2040]